MASMDPSVLFRRLVKIGKGSFGEVYKGVQINTNKVIAIKILNLETDDDDIEEMQKEIMLLARCDHENIVKYYGSYLCGSKLWIIMDFCGGGSLRGIMKSGPFEEHQIAMISRDMLYALSYLHRNGIIHRDIKAANVLLNEEGYLKLCDFGVSGLITASSMRKNSFVGTPYWMAPEVIRRSQYDFKADIWSLGVTIYEITTGNPPFHEKDPMRAIFLIPRSNPAKLEGENHSKLLKEFVSLCLNDDPKERPGAEDLLKNAFLKKAKKGATLVELVMRHKEWLAHGNTDTDLTGRTVDGVSAAKAINKANAPVPEGGESLKAKRPKSLAMITPLPVIDGIRDGEKIMAERSKQVSEADVWDNDWSFGDSPVRESALPPQLKIETIPESTELLVAEREAGANGGGSSSGDSNANGQSKRARTQSDGVIVDKAHDDAVTEKARRRTSLGSDRPGSSGSSGSKSFSSNQSGPILKAVKHALEANNSDSRSVSSRNTDGEDGKDEKEADKKAPLVSAAPTESTPPPKIPSVDVTAGSPRDEPQPRSAEGTLSKKGSASSVQSGFARSVSTEGMVIPTSGSLSPRLGDPNANRVMRPKRSVSSSTADGEEAAPTLPKRGSQPNLAQPVLNQTLISQPLASVLGQSAVPSREGSPRPSSVSRGITPSGSRRSEYMEMNGIAGHAHGHGAASRIGRWASASAIVLGEGEEHETPNGRSGSFGPATSAMHAAGRMSNRKISGGIDEDGPASGPMTSGWERDRSGPKNVTVNLPLGNVHLPAQRHAQRNSMHLASGGIVKANSAFFDGYKQDDRRGVAAAAPRVDGGSMPRARPDLLQHLPCITDRDDICGVMVAAAQESLQLLASVEATMRAFSLGPSLGDG